MTNGPKQSTPYKRGFGAGKRGVQPHENPYHHGTSRQSENFRAWESGRRAGEAAAQPTPTPSPLLLGIERQHAETVARRESQHEEEAHFLIARSRRDGEADVFEAIEIHGSRSGHAMMFHQSHSYEAALAELMARHPEVRDLGGDDRRRYFALPQRPGPTSALLREQALALRRAAAEQIARADALESEASSMERTNE